MTVDQAQRRAFRVTAPCVALALAVACAPALFERYAFARGVWLARATGWTALVALGLSLCATPAIRVLTRFFPRERARGAAPLFAAFRRALGLSAAVVAATHFAIVLATYLRGVSGAIIETPFLRSGLLALALLLVLTLTSFPAVNRAARVKLWKHLHRLAYAVALLALHHILLSPFAPRAVSIAFFGALLAIGLLRFLPGPPVTSPRS